MMRRDQFVAALANVKNAIDQSKILPMLVSVMRTGKTDEVSGGAAFANYAAFMNAYERFGDAEKKILTTFKLDPLVDPSFWERFVKAGGPPAGLIIIRQGSQLVTEFLPRLINLLSRSSDRELPQFDDPTKTGAKVDAARIRFFVRDPEVPTLTVKHFSTILNSVEELHSAIETIEHLKHSDLVVASLDSGSDKEFDLLGIAAAVEKLSQTLLEVWNRIQSAKAVKAKVNYAAACDGIEVLVKLHAAESTHAIPKEQAESIRRTVVSSITTLFENGVYTEAMEGQVFPTPSALPIDRRKLLTHQTSNPQGPAAPPDDLLADEDIEM